MGIKVTLDSPNIDKPIVIEHNENGLMFNGKQILGIENTFDITQNNVQYFSDYKLGGLLDYFKPNEQFPDGYDTLEMYSKRLKDQTFGNIDLRQANMSNFITNGFAKKLVEKIYHDSALLADCSEAIAETAQTIIKNCPLLVPNKAHNIDPAKWYMLIYEKAKVIAFCKTVALDIDDNYLFEAISLKNEKERTDKLLLVTAYHMAVRSGKNIAQAVNNLKEKWYNELMYRYVNLITDTAHKIYWTPIAFDMVPIHNNYFATIPVADWFFYPYFAMIRSYFSRTEPNMFLAIGPPMKLLKAPPYPGKVIVDIGLYLKYRSPLFGKLSFSRNGKEY